MKISDDVLAVLSRATVEGCNLTLTGQLDRQMYVQVNKVLEASGGKWNRKARVHIFDKDAAERIDEIILTGEVEIPKDEFNYFPTPPAIVERLLELAEIKAGMRVLEPSAGQGHIALAFADRGAIVDCVELMEANYDVIAGHPKLGDVSGGCFLERTPQGNYDRVVMNPPFQKQADIIHVLHALNFLKAGGKLVSVMSAGVCFRENKLTTQFRNLIMDRNGSIEKLPEGSFKTSGTMVNTVIVVIPA